MSASDLIALLGSMDERDASDLFLTEGRAPAARVHGSIEVLDAPVTTADALAAFIAAVLPEGARERFSGAGDLDAGYTLPDGRRFRLNLSRQQGRVAVVWQLPCSGPRRTPERPPPSYRLPGRTPLPATRHSSIPFAVPARNRRSVVGLCRESECAFTSLRPTTTSAN